MQQQAIQTIVVCGAGTMGSGIAQVAAQSGFHTILFDMNPAMLEKARLAIEGQLNKLAAKEKISPHAITKLWKQLSFTANINHCIGELVIEAIIEKQAIKAGLFNQLAAINASNTIFATNTSSISIDALAKDLTCPNQLVGMHFFNPAPIMKLVEIIEGANTSPAVVETVFSIAEAMGKTPVICKDAPGFIVNRVARHYYLEAMELVESGLADIEQVDKILEAAGFKMGPFKLMDLIGMDINYSVSNIVWEALGKPDRLIPSALQKQKVDQGALGKKTGKGFYTY
ncbi:MAG: 3-hydroxybutyryl-CoA dehydrogenase [Sphingobacteriia bacterium]|nr:MAG: 3-hydroxybutyryl-CoA dehydrogenase [Sphingobacteriia bacterium]